MEEPNDKKAKRLTFIWANGSIQRLLRRCCLPLVIVIYTSVGAKIFQYLEYQYDKKQQQNMKMDLRNQRKSFLITLLSTFEYYCVEGASNVTDYPQSGAVSTEESTDRLLELSQVLEGYEAVLEDSFGNGILPLSLKEEDEGRWIYLQCLFFSVTVLTTIGYGNIAPATAMGRLFCIVFALIGIPLYLTFIADLGDLLASLIPAAAIARLIPRIKYKTILTVFGTVSLLLGFISLGGALFMWLEKSWSFLDAVYFCFITTTTIGFGDLVPETASMLYCTLYILMGMGLTSTVIELVRRQYASSWQKMKELTARIHALSGPLAEAMKKMVTTGIAEVKVDTALVRELKDICQAIAVVQNEDEKGLQNAVSQEEDPWSELLNIAEKKKRILVFMYETSV